MKRDLSSITRNLESNKNNDIIYRKALIEKIFKEDPDLQEVLGVRDKRPLNKFIDPDHPTEQEKQLRKEIEEYNRRADARQIVPYLKLNGVQKEVNNFIMFDIRDYDVSYTNKNIKNQQLVVMCAVHEDDMDTQYNIQRTDLLSYIVKDLLSWSNVAGLQLKCISDFDDIVDDRYYCRVLKFESQLPNAVNNHSGTYYQGMTNRFDQLP